MVKVMIADDEGIVIESLKYIINKNFAGQCEIESAKTGRAVVELAEWFRPDIAFMDIHMGGINGIDAMKEIRRFSSATIFIIVSAYDKFDYAREAINLGVLEYVNKPIEKKKIVDTLSRAIHMIEEQRSRRSKELLIREKLETVVPIIEAGFMNEILYLEHFDVDVESFKSLLGIQALNGYLVVFVFGDEQIGNEMTNVVGATVRVQNLYQKIREIIKERLAGIVGAVMGNKIPVYIPVEKESMEYQERIEAIARARNVSQELEQQFQMKFRAGIGKVYPMKEAGQSFIDALNALVQSTARVAHVNDLPIGCAYEENYPVDLEKELFSAISHGDTVACQEKAKAFFQWMIDNYPEQSDDIKLKVLEFVLWAERIAYESGGMKYRFTSRSGYLSTVIGVSTMEQLRTWFLDKLLVTCRNVTGKKKEHSLSQMERAVQYIQSNYQRDISLDDVSMELNLSPYYFSKLFKEQTGENFIEYLTKTRICKAKSLLLDTAGTVREVGVAVGYQDPNYFSRIFKKNVGVTPTEFKEEMRK